MVGLRFPGLEAEDNICVKCNYWLKKQNLFLKDEARNKTEIFLKGLS